MSAEMIGPAILMFAVANAGVNLGLLVLRFRREAAPDPELEQVAGVSGRSAPLLENLRLMLDGRRRRPVVVVGRHEPGSGGTWLTQDTLPTKQKMRGEGVLPVGGPPLEGAARSTPLGVGWRGSPPEVPPATSERHCITACQLKRMRRVACAQPWATAKAGDATGWSATAGGARRWSVPSDSSSSGRRSRLGTASPASLGIAWRGLGTGDPKSLMRHTLGNVGIG